MNDQTLAKEILQAVGGAKNVGDYSHCATSLRLKINDWDLVDDASVRQAKDVLTTVQTTNHYQIVIGLQVPKVFEAFKAMVLMDETEDGTDAKAGSSLMDGVTELFSVVASIFTPVLPALAGSGILRGLLILLTQIGWLSETSGTYQVMTIASLAVFYFLPVLLAISAAERFRIDPYISALLAMILIHPDLIQLIESIQAGEVVRLLGTPLTAMSYQSTVVPILLAIYAYSFLYRFLAEKVTENLKMVVVPFVSLIVMVPLTLIAIGPLGIWFSDLIANGVHFLVDFSRILTGLVIGGGYSLLVSFGMHWAINPIMINNVSVYGYDYLDPFTFACNFAVIGALIGVYFKVRDQRLRGFSLTCVVTILLSAIIEPGLFGVLLKYRKVLLAQVIGGAVGAAYMALFQGRTNSFVFGSIPTLPALIGDTPANLIHALIGMAIALVVAAILAYILSDRDYEL